MCGAGWPALLDKFRGRRHNFGYKNFQKEYTNEFSLHKKPMYQADGGCSFYRRACLMQFHAKGNAG
jgi:hypothetical protein